MITFEEKKKDLYSNLDNLVDTYIKNVILIKNGNRPTRYDPLVLDRFSLLYILNNFDEICKNESHDNKLFVYNGLCLKINRQVCTDAYKPFGPSNEKNYLSNDVPDAIYPVSDYLGDTWNHTFDDIKLNTLPLQRITYKGCSIGFIYPYYRNYKTFKELSGESKELIINNLYSFRDKFCEFFECGLIYRDCKLANILYKEKDVQIIDFDCGLSFRKFNNDLSDGIVFYRMVIEQVLKAALEKNTINEVEYNRIMNDCYYSVLNYMQNIETYSKSL